MADPKFTADGNATPDTIAILARAFADQIREWTSDEELAEIRRRNAGPDYAGDIACATHDFMDANEAMAEAFRKTFGRECLLPSDAEESRATEADVEREMGLWNAAWSEAKAKYLTEG